MAGGLYQAGKPWRPGIPVEWNKQVNLELMKEVLEEHDKLTKQLTRSQMERGLTVAVLGPTGHGRSSTVNGLHCAIENSFHVLTAKTIEGQKFKSYRPMIPTIVDDEIGVKGYLEEETYFNLKLADYIGARRTRKETNALFASMPHSYSLTSHTRFSANKLADMLFWDSPWDGLEISDPDAELDDVNCVIWVLDVNSKESDVHETKKFFAPFSEQSGIPQFLALTKCDELEQSAAENPQMMYMSADVKHRVSQISKWMKIPENRAFPIKNRVREMNADPNLTYQYLYMLKYILTDITSHIRRIRPKSKPTDSSSIPLIEQEHKESHFRKRMETGFGTLDSIKLQSYIHEEDEKTGSANILKWMCAEAEKAYGNINVVWPGYRPTAQKELVFVAMIKKHASTLPKEFYGFELCSRTIKHVSDEGIKIAKYEREKQLQFSEEQRRKLHKAITDTSDLLMRNHRKLEIVTASHVKCSGFGTRSQRFSEEPCIALYVPIKGIIPVGESEFPKKIGGFKVDVREGYFSTTADPKHYHEKLLMGCQISAANEQCGTLGAFVNLPNRKIGCLTCWHIFTPGKLLWNVPEKVDLDVYQPDPKEENGRIGTVTEASLEKGGKHTIGTDAALIELTEEYRYPQSGKFPSDEDTGSSTGFPKERPLKFGDGRLFRSFQEIPTHSIVVKYGKTTRITRGMVGIEGIGVRREVLKLESKELGDYELHQQIEVNSCSSTQFSDAGDSGSLVMVVDGMENECKLTALGLVVGVTSYNSTIITPIWAILSVLKLPLELYCFPLETDIAEIREEMKTLKEHVDQKFSSVDKKLEDVNENVKKVLNKMTKT